MFYSAWAGSASNSNGEIILISDKENLVVDSGKKGVSGFTIYGQTVANATVKAYIFSDPAVWTTTSDASGNWSIDVTSPVAVGSHEVFTVAIVGDEVYKAAAVKYLAVSLNPLQVEFANIDLPETGDSVSAPNLSAGNLLKYLPAILIILICTAIGTAAIYRNSKEQNNKITGKPGKVKKNSRKTRLFKRT